MIEWIEKHPLIVGYVTTATTAATATIPFIWNQLGAIFPVVFLILIEIALIIWIRINPENKMAKNAAWIVGCGISISITFFGTRWYDIQQTAPQATLKPTTSCKPDGGSGNLGDSKALCKYIANDAGSKSYSIDGIGTIMTKWSNLQHFNGEVGNLFKEILDNDNNATWYILNFSPYALSDRDDATI
ncbi:MAG: hypothetical protein WA624_17410 [Methylocella sp.]